MYVCLLITSGVLCLTLVMPWPGEPSGVFRAKAGGGQVLLRGVALGLGTPVDSASAGAAHGMTGVKDIQCHPWPVLSLKGTINE